jgi:hypothetical protein
MWPAPPILVDHTRDGHDLAAPDRCVSLPHSHARLVRASALAPATNSKNTSPVKCPGYHFALMPFYFGDIPAPHNVYPYPLRYHYRACLLLLAANNPYTLSHLCSIALIGSQAREAPEARHTSSSVWSPCCSESERTP